MSGRLAPLLVVVVVALLQCSFGFEEADEEAVADFTEWLNTNGVNTSAWEILPTGDGRGRGVFATKPLVAGQVIVSVPISLSFGVQAALSHDRIGPLLRGTLSRPPDDFHEDCLATSALLLDAHVKGEASHWAPYLALLPPVGQAGTSPCDGFGARADFGAMPNGMRVLCADYERTMNTLFEELDGGLLEPLLGAKYGEKLERRNVWKWAIGVSWSRGQGKVYNASTHGCFLVPGLDMMNHGSSWTPGIDTRSPSVATAGEPGASGGDGGVREVATQLFGAEPYDGTTGVVAQRAYAAGEELRVAYFPALDGGGPLGSGLRCQQSIYLQYGFVLPGELERDCLPLEVPLRGANGKLLGVPGNNVAAAELPTFVLGNDGVAPPRMLDTLRAVLGVGNSAPQRAEIEAEEAAAARVAATLSPDSKSSKEEVEAAAAALVAAQRTTKLQGEKPLVLCAFEELLQAVERDHAKCAAVTSNGNGGSGAGAATAVSYSLSAFKVLREAEERVLTKARQLVGAALEARDIDCLQVEAPFAGSDNDIEIEEVTDLD